MFDIRRIAIVAVVVLAIAGATAYFSDYGASAQSPAVATEALPRSSASPSGPTITLPDFRTVAAQVVPSVVTVRSKTRVDAGRTPMGGDFFERFFGFRHPDTGPGDGGGGYTQHGLGSGVIVSDEGYILTNNHVVAEVDSVEVVDSEGEVYRAETVGTDPKSDLAVLKVEGAKLRPIRLGDSNQLEVGEWVLAVGNPFSERLGHTVTAGIVSATGRSALNLATYEDFIQTDAAINPGNSGGALVNVRGELVGINTAIVSRSGGYQGIGFAIPIDMASDVMRQLIDTGRVSRGYLGVGIQSVNRDLAEGLGLADPSGVLITQVLDESPAGDAGIESGDVVVAVDGESVKDAPDLQKRIGAKAPGNRVELEVLRNGARKSFKVKLAELPDQPDDGRARERSEVASKLGVTVAPLTDELAARLDVAGHSGVVVTGVQGGGPAGEAGLQRGDLITEVNRQPVRSVDDYRSALDAVDSGKVVLFKVRRGSNVAYIPVRP